MEMPNTYIFVTQMFPNILGFIMSKDSLIKKANKFSKKILKQIFIIFYVFRKEPQKAW